MQRLPDAAHQLADVLDAIDAVVSPGTDLARGEKNDASPSLLDAAARRR